MLMLAIGVAFITIILLIKINKGGKNKMSEKKYNKDGSINLQWFAEEITKREGKKVEVNIGQVKEVLKVSLGILHELYNESADKVQRLIENS